MGARLNRLLGGTRGLSAPTPTQNTADCGLPSEGSSPACEDWLRDGDRGGSVGSSAETTGTPPFLSNLSPRLQTLLFPSRAKASNGLRFTRTISIQHVVGHSHSPASPSPPSEQTQQHRARQAETGPGHPLRRPFQPGRRLRGLGLSGPPSRAVSWRLLPPMFRLRSPPTPQTLPATILTNFLPSPQRPSCLLRSRRPRPSELPTVQAAGSHLVTPTGTPSPLPSVQ